MKFTKASAYKNMCMMYVTSIFASLKYLPSLENQKKITTKKKENKKELFLFCIDKPEKNCSETSFHILIFTQNILQKAAEKNVLFYCVISWSLYVN